MPKIRVALLISVLIAPTTGLAQTAPTKAGLAGRIRLPAIQLADGMMREAVNRESTRWAAMPSLSRQQSRDRSWAARHPVLCGALIGLGAGLAVEAAVIPGASGGEPHSAYLPLFGGMGAGIGSLVGLIVSAAR